MEESYDDHEEHLVLQIDGSGSKPFYMEGTMSGNCFKVIIDNGSPVSIFTKRDLQKIFGERKADISYMVDNERYNDYNERIAGVFGLSVCALKSCRVTVSKVRVLVAPKSGKSIFSPDW